MANFLRSLSATLQREAVRFVQRQLSTSSTRTARSQAGEATARQPMTRQTPAREPMTAPALSQTYPGDFEGPVQVTYAPHPDGEPDPGEVVWAWVPYEEDYTRGKDRPVLLIGHDGPWLLGLQLTSQDHDRDAEQERRAGRVWVDIGAGAWDSKGRPSEARVNRILRLNPDGIRREGAVLSPEIFAGVAAAVQAHT